MKTKQNPKHTVENYIILKNKGYSNKQIAVMWRKPLSSIAAFAANATRQSDKPSLKEHINFAKNRKQEIFNHIINKSLKSKPKLTRTQFLYHANVAIKKIGILNNAATIFSPEEVESLKLIYSQVRY